MCKKISAIIVPTILAIGIIGFMLYWVWGDLIQALKLLEPQYLAIEIIICFIAWWLRGWRYLTILNSLDYQVSVAVATACIFVSQTANLIVPARLGDFVRVFILKHEYKTTYSEGVSSLVVERIFDIGTIAFLGAVSLLFVLNARAEFYIIIFVPIIASLVFFGILLFLGKNSSKNRYIQIILTMLHEIKHASLSPRPIVLLGGSSLVIWVIDILVCYAVVLMFQQQIPFAVIVLAIVIGNLVKAVPLTPGGIGTYELALAVTFGLGGAAPAIATLIAVIDHLIKNLVTLAGGIFSIYYFGDWVVPSIKDAFSSKFSGEDTTDR